MGLPTINIIISIIRSLLFSALSGGRAGVAKDRKEPRSVPTSGELRLMMTRRKKILHDRQGIPRSTEIYVRNPFSTNTAIVLCCAPFLILASFPAAANLLRFASQQEEKSSLPKKKGSNQHLPKKIKESFSPTFL